MPLYEYYCEKCDDVFESLRPVAQSENPTACPTCGKLADRILPTTFASRSFKGGWARRVPFHHHPVRADAGPGKRTIARVKAKEDGKPKSTAKRSKKAGGGKA